MTKEEVGACVGGRRARDDRVNERREKEKKDTHSWRGRNMLKKKETEEEKDGEEGRRRRQAAVRERGGG